MHIDTEVFGFQIIGTIYGEIFILHAGHTVTLTGHKAAQLKHSLGKINKNSSTYLRVKQKRALYLSEMKTNH
jgi:hypothetical protein